MRISRRDALATGAAAITVTAITAPLAIKAASVQAALADVPTAVAAQVSDAELIALGQQWQEAYAEWLQREDDEDGTLLKRACTIEDKMKDIPTRSPNGALVKLRVAAEHYRLMGDIDDDPYALLTYQAWQGLETEPINFERLMREARS